MRACTSCSCEKGRRHFEEELERLREAGAQNDIAYAAALRLCVVERKCPPQWLIERIDDLLTELLKRERSAKRGRSRGRIARCRQDLWDSERYDSVQEVRRIRQENPERLASIKDCSPELRKRFGHYEKVDIWLKHGTFECASMYLRGTYAWGSPHAVKASYRRVQRAMTTRTKSMRYYMFPGDFLKRVGIPYPLTYMPGNKFIPFYDLKP